MGTPSLTITTPKPQGASNIMIGWICPGDVTNAFAGSLMDTMLGDPAGRVTARVSLQSSPRIAQARNDMVAAFLESNQDWLLMIDADMAWKYEDFDRLCKAADPERRPIIGGLCFGGGRAGVGGKLNIFPTLYNISDTENGQIISDPVMEYPRNKVMRVGATGAAFLMVHKKVFVDIGKVFYGHPFPWFMESVIRNKPIGEDITFCIRATSLEFPVFVHTGVKIGHEKRFYLTEELYDDHRATD